MEENTSENAKDAAMEEDKDKINKDETLDSSVPEEMFDDIVSSNQEGENKGSAKGVAAPSPPSSEQAREAMKRKWDTALEEIDSNGAYRLSKYRKLEEEKLKAVEAAVEASESAMLMHYQSLPVTPLAAITGRNKRRNTHHDILALIVSVSPDTTKRSGMPLKRELWIMDISTIKKVCLSVFIDAQNFVPEPGTVALFKHLVTQEFDDGSLSAFSKEFEGKDWFIPDPPGFENGEVAQLKDCWARRQFNEQASFDEEDMTHHLEPLDIPEEDDIADHLPTISGRKHLTCYYWAKNGKCRNLDEECAYAHYNTGIVARDPMRNQNTSDADSNKDPSKEIAPGLPPSRSLTCYFWARNRKCNRTDEDCSYAHYDTGTVARPPPGITVFDDSKDSAASIPFSKTLTCYFWDKDKKCSRSDEECAYAHYDTGTVAHPPPQVVTTSAPTSNTEVSASTVPSKNLTCFFYARDGKCNRSDSECRYAHYHTGITANNPNQPLVPEAGQTKITQISIDRRSDTIQPTSTPGGRSSSMTLTTSARPTSASSETSAGSFPPAKSLTCYFWANFGRCKRSDTACNYAHFHTGRMAVNPMELPRKRRLE